MSPEILLNIGNRQNDYPRSKFGIILFWFFLNKQYFFQATFS